MEDFVKRVWDVCIGINKKYGTDPFGYEVKFEEYGLKTKCGWTIDHVWPLSPNGKDYKEGSKSMQNLQVLSNKANNKKSNLVTGKINNVIFAVTKISEDKEKRNIGRMKVQIDSQWYWAYNDWKEK